jgi:hypothetical protein
MLRKNFYQEVVIVLFNIKVIFIFLEDLVNTIFNVLLNEFSYQKRKMSPITIRLNLVVNVFLHQLEKIFGK